MVFPCSEENIPFCIGEVLDIIKRKQVVLQFYETATPPFGIFKLATNEFNESSKSRVRIDDSMQHFPALLEDGTLPIEIIQLIHDWDLQPSIFI